MSRRLLLVDALDGESSGTTAQWLQHGVELRGVDLEQSRTNPHGFELAGGYPATNGAVMDAAPFGSLGQADEFRMATFAAVGWVRHVSPKERNEENTCCNSQPMWL
ncbi:hypothetical protein [Mycolicibacter sinensis]|uniref:hypothetical protein n=1 Tax=Mycolicibacter sinensis (strain JDM601) TaxID=875328 RepID=UPI003D1608F1